MQPYVEPIWGWDDAFQHLRFKRMWAPQNIQIFSLKEREIGYYEVHEIEGRLKLDNIFVHEDYRGKGVGARVLRDMIERYKEQYQIMTLNVLHNNPACNLYKRLGFQFVKVNDQVHEYELLTKHL